MGTVESYVMWESSDIDPSNSHIYRQYSYIEQAIFNDIPTDTTGESFIISYPNEMTNLGYDVDIKYLSCEPDEYINVTYTKVLYKTSYIDDYVYMVGYYKHESSEDRTLNSYIRRALIRANAGHILDKFFEWFIVYKYGDDKDYLESFKKDSDDVDPLDDIGINFEDNPEYNNGGYYYHSVSLNNHIISFDQLNQSERNISLYNGVILNVYDDKLKTFINNWIDSYKIDYDKDEKIDRWFLGIQSFWNNYIAKQEIDIWFVWGDVSLKKNENKEWSYQTASWIITVYLHIKNSQTGKIDTLYPPYQNSDGKLESKYGYYESQKEEIVNVFENISNTQFKNLVLYYYISAGYISANGGYFIQNIYNGIPEKYIDLFTILQNSSDELAYDKLDLCIGLVNNTFLNEDICNYSECFFDIVDYFIEYIVNESSLTTAYTLKKYNVLLKPLLYIKDNGYIEVEHSVESYNLKNKFLQSNQIIEFALQMLYVTKCSHQIQYDNIMTETLMDCCGMFTTDDNSVYWIGDAYTDFGGYVQSTFGYNKHRFVLLTDIISKMLSIDTNIYPYNCYNILYLHAVYEIERTVQKLEEGEPNYCGRSTTKILSKHSMNLVNVVNLLINKIAKDKDKKRIFEKTINGVDKIIGGHTKLTSWGETSSYIKLLSFFLLCTDRYQEDMVDRLLIIVDKQQSIIYPTICGVTIDFTIKDSIIRLFSKMWENKMNDTHFDFIEDCIQNYLDKDDIVQYSDKKALYTETKNKIDNYLSGI